MEKLYLIGLEDNGTAIGISMTDLIISLRHLIKISNIINSKIYKLNIYKCTDRFIATIRLNKNIENKLFIH